MYLVARDLGDGRRIEVCLAGVVGAADVYIARDELTKPAQWTRKITGAHDGCHIISDLKNDQWYMVMGIDATNTPTTVERVRPFNPTPFYSIDLLKEASTIYPESAVRAYRLRASVEKAVNMPAEVFLYERQPFREYDEREYRDVFVAVCAPGDLSAYPVLEPPVEEPRFYRLSYVDMDFRSITALEEAYEALKHDLRELLLAMDALRRMERAEICHIYSGICEPVPPTPSSSSSLSSSSSSLSA